MGDPSRYTDEIVISWPELHRDARFLSQQLHDIGSWKGMAWSRRTTCEVKRKASLPAAMG